MTTPSEPTVAASYDLADQLVQIRAADDSLVSITHDSRGNPVERREAAGHTHFTWDVAGHLTTVRSSEGTHTTHHHDGDGNLLAERLSNDRGGGEVVERRLTVDVARALPEVVSVTEGEKTAGFVYGLGRLASLELGSEDAYYFVPDLRGSVRLVADGGGGSVDKRNYDAWGTPDESSSASSPVGYTGELQDPADGLVYLRARWYEPASGRFLSPDPMPGRLMAPMSQHPYVYVQANPTSRLTNHSGRTVGSPRDEPGCQLGQPRGESGRRLGQEAPVLLVLAAS